MAFALSGRGCQLAHVHLAALEFDLAVDQGEQRVIGPAADIETGVKLRAALADDDRPGGDGLPAVGFDATVLRVGVATVAAGPAALFMCHKSPVVLLLRS